MSAAGGGEGGGGKLIPPFRYSIVEEGLYRGAYPSERNFRFLRRLKLKTIVSLIPKSPQSSLVTFCADEGILLKHVEVAKFKDDLNMSPLLVASLLELMIDPHSLPLYVHCLDGVHITGIVVMCLRKLQNWHLSSTYRQSTRFTRAATLQAVESEFVELFNPPEIVVAANPPAWLWGGHDRIEHPVLNLKFPSASSVAAAASAAPSSSSSSSSTAVSVAKRKRRRGKKKGGGGGGSSNSNSGNGDLLDLSSGSGGGHDGASSAGSGSDNGGQSERGMGGIAGVGGGIGSGQDSSRASSPLSRSNDAGGAGVGGGAPSGGVADVGVGDGSAADVHADDDADRMAQREAALFNVNLLELDEWQLTNGVRALALEGV